MYHFTISNNVTKQLSKTCQSQFLTLICCLALVLDPVLSIKMTLVWQFLLWKAHKTQLSTVCPPQFWSSSFFFLTFHLFAVHYCLFMLFPRPLSDVSFPSIFVCSRLHLRLWFVQTHLLALTVMLLFWLFITLSQIASVQPVEQLLILFCLWSLYTECFWSRCRRTLLFVLFL